MTPRAQVKKICLALPEATEERSGRHAAFLVRNKKFAYYLDDHHGDGRLAVTTRAAPGQNTALVASDPGRFFIPSYIGSRGWVGLYLDVGPFDWDEVDDLVVDSYLLVAPKRLAALVDAGSS
ncbi:MAG: MmcQ/YjbR family DNA-binding protein [Actinobacteria bacterium]|nr:MmcQ/YjbR family DNA-binding protein [Actinomycetota bacterium]